MHPHLKPLSCWCATMPYLSSAKACAITMGPDTCPYVSTFTTVSTMWAPVRLPGVCFLTNACGSPIARTSSAPARLQAGSGASVLQGIEEGHELSAWHQPAAQNPQDGVRLWLGTQR